MNLSKSKVLLAIYVALAAIYVICSLLIPINMRVASHYKLTNNQVHILSLTVIIPYIIIWFIAFYGYDRFDKYVQTIKKSHDGKALQVISNGILLLSLYLPISAIASLIVSEIESKSTRFLPTASILVNYIMLAILLTGFTLLLNGSQKLVASTKHQTYPIRARVVFGIFVIISALYGYATMNNPVRQFPSTPGGHAAYYLADIPLLLTIVIPYIYIWYAGIMSAYNIHVYCVSVPGVIYKKALNYLAYGIAISATGIMVIRFVGSISMFINNQAALHTFLIMIYAVLILIAVSYIFIAIGANRLHKIEEA